MSTQLTSRSDSELAGDADRVNVVYVVMREGLSSVFDSQVLSRLAQHGNEVLFRLAVFAPLGHRLRPALRRQTNGVCRRAQGEYGLCMSYLLSPPSRARWLWSDASVFRSWLKRHYEPGGSVVIHCRCAEATEVALEARRSFGNARVIYDCRGVECDEFIYENRLEGRPITSWPKKLRDEAQTRARRERVGVQEADAVFTVSGRMTRHLAEKYDVPADRFVEIPCCVASSAFDKEFARREEVRRQLGVQDKLLITYCGSMAWYQLPDASLRIFRLIKRAIPSAHFLAVTTQPRLMEQAARRDGIPVSEMTILSAAPQDVPKYLVASDIGLLLREQTIVNRVASPVKFGEYMASGTPVIITPGVGDYSDAVAANRLGVVVDLARPDEDLCHRLTAWLTEYASTHHAISARCRDFAKTHLSWDQFIPVASSVYQRLAVAHHEQP